MKDWELVVIGDKKTPGDYRLDRGIYVTPEEQEKYDPALSKPSAGTASSAGYWACSGPTI